MVAICGEIIHWAKDHPLCISIDTPILVIRGRGSTKGVRGIGNGAPGGGKRTT